MPAILVAAGGYSLLGGAAAAGGGWALFAAGTMVVSGLMARKAEIDGNKDAAAGWMAVGTIASLGAQFTTPDAALAGGAGGTNTAASNAAVYGPTAEAGSGLGPNALADGSAVNQVSTMGNVAAPGVANAAAVPGTTSGAAEWAKATAARDARMAEIASTNLKVQVGAGLAQAGVAWQAGEEQAKIKREQIAEERRLSDRQYANTNNLVGLKVQTPSNLPNLMSSARRQGLINATATTVQ